MNGEKVNISKQSTSPIFLEINDCETLKQLYIPFFKNGGLFIPCNTHDLQLGDAVNIKLKLLEEANLFEFKGKVIWLAPSEERDSLMKSVGLEFDSPHTEILRNKIELYCSDMDKYN